MELPRRHRHIGQTKGGSGPETSATGQSRPSSSNCLAAAPDTRSYGSFGIRVQSIQALSATYRPNDRHKPTPVYPYTEHGVHNLELM